MESEGHLNSEELFKKYAPFVARFLVRMGVWEHDLDDLLQEVFLVAHRKGGYRPGAASPTTYLASLAIRAAAAYRRKNRAKNWMELNPNAAESIPNDQQNPLQLLVRQVDIANVRDALDSLDPEKRAVFVLVEIEGESCVSVAEGLNVPLNTVYSRLRAARARFCKAAKFQMRKTEQTNLSHFPECVL